MPASALSTIPMSLSLSLWVSKPIYAFYEYVSCLPCCLLKDRHFGVAFGRETLNLSSSLLSLSKQGKGRMGRQAWPCMHLLLGKWQAAAYKYLSEPALFGGSARMACAAAEGGKHGSGRTGSICSWRLPGAGSGSSCACWGDRHEVAVAARASLLCLPL